MLTSTEQDRIKSKEVVKNICNITSNFEKNPLYWLKNRLKLHYHNLKMTHSPTGTGNLTTNFINFTFKNQKPKIRKTL
jgi:hypothetical protein